jgi:GntR family transcriptional regulator
VSGASDLIERPAYLRAQDAMLRMIEDENLQPGDRIPSERALSETLGLSRQTVRRALEDLVREGTLERRSTSGTHVAAPRPFVRNIGTRRSGSIYRAMARGGHTPGRRLLFIEQTLASRLVAEHLRLPVRTPLIVIRRLLSIDAAPVCIETSHIPAERVPGLVAADVLEAPSLYGLLEARYGIEFGDREATIAAEPVLPQDAALLGLEPGVNALVYRLDVADADGRPIEHTISINHPERVTFSTSLTPG